MRKITLYRDDSTTQIVFENEEFGRQLEAARVTSTKLPS